MAVDAAASAANKMGYQVHTIPHLITGEVEAAARELLQTAIHYDGPKPVCIIQGGETTVKVTGQGKGGRNQHFVLTALYELSQQQDQSLIDNMTILSGGTDGTDGPTDATGAIGDKTTLVRAKHQQLEMADYVSAHDAYHFFQLTNSLIITGPTQTNVMDLMMAIVQ